MIFPLPHLSAWSSPESWLLALACLSLLPACATLSRTERPGVSAPAEPLPVLMVHGIDDEPACFKPLEQRLREEGWTELVAMRMWPNRGQAPLEVLAYQVGQAAARLRARTGAEHIDVVSFSMGALVTRYWLQELEGHRSVRRFISISGPHHGTWTAWLRGGDGVAQMRPGSSFLQALASSPRSFGQTEVFSFWTPNDLMIFPASSSRLPAAMEERTFPVLLHPMMLSDGGVLSAVLEVLSRPSASAEGSAAP